MPLHMACAVLGTGSRSTYLLNVAGAANLHFSASVVAKLRHSAILPPMHHEQYRLVVHLSWRRWPVYTAFMLDGLKSHRTAAHVGEEMTAESLAHARHAVFSRPKHYRIMNGRMALRRTIMVLLMHPSYRY